MIPSKNSVKLFHFILWVSWLITFWWPPPPWNLQKKKICENWFISIFAKNFFYLKRRIRKCTNDVDGTFLFQQSHIRIDIMTHWNSVKDQIQSLGIGSLKKIREIKIQIGKKKFVKSKYHWFFIFRDDVIISTNLFGKGFFLVASWDNSYMITHGFGKEDSHLSKTAKTLKKAKKIVYFGCKK